MPKKQKFDTPAEATIHVVLDRSGSMAVIKSQTIKGFNGYCQEVCKTAPKSRLSLTVFGGSDLATVIDDKEIGSVVQLTDSSYQPGGGTPLYDAIGHAIGLLDDASGANKVMVIITDGEENQSTKFTKETIRALLSERQEEENWLVIYLGANQDAFAEGAKFGSRMGSTMNYAAQNMAQTMAVAARSTSSYAATASLDAAAFTEAERKKVMKK